MTNQSAAATCQVRESGIEIRFLPHRDRGTDEEIMAVRQEERLRIARELHDTCLQGFLALLMHLRVAACDCSGNNILRSRLEGLVEMACDAVEEGRRSVETLRASAQPLESLEAAFAKIPRGLGLNTAVPLQVSVRGDARELSAVVWHEVYRIGREAILNAYRHSGAGEIHATIEYEPGGLRLCVRDNGCGIGSSELVSGRPGHWGLQGMRERARRIGAKLQFQTVSGSGTALELFVHCTQHEHPSAK
jgi:signal transduction histidine kinase